jgi:hypothetical protein
VHEGFVVVHDRNPRWYLGESGTPGSFNPVMMPRDDPPAGSTITPGHIGSVH